MSKEMKFHHITDDAGCEDTVGYGKPPKQHQFKRGQSGNPKGRKPRTAYEEHDLPFRKYLMEMTTAKVNGKIATVTKFDTILLRLYQKAMEGDFKSLKLLVEQSGGFREFRADYIREMNEADRKAIDEVIKAADLFLGSKSRKNEK
jgi:Family of unknown function (DUF5681)